MSQQHRDRAEEDEDFVNFPRPDFLSEASMLKPKLDSIFAEVEQNLPDIDFEMSDVSFTPGFYSMHRKAPCLLK